MSVSVRMCLAVHLSVTGNACFVQVQRPLATLRAYGNKLLEQTLEAHPEYDLAQAVKLQVVILPRLRLFNLYGICLFSMRSGPDLGWTRLRFAWCIILLLWVPLNLILQATRTCLSRRYQQELGHQQQYGTAWN